MLEKIVAAVRAAGDMIRDAHNIERDTREKTGAADLVTKYDVAVQEFLRRELLGICRRPISSARRGSTRR